MWPHSFVAFARTCFVPGCDCTLFFTFACRLADTKHADVLLAFKHGESFVNHLADVVFVCVVFGGVII